MGPRSSTPTMPIVRGMGARTSARPLTYGFAEDADVGAEAVTSAGLEGMTFILRLPDGRHAATIPALGPLSVHNGLAGAAVGLAAGLSADEIVGGLRDGWSAPHRAEVVRAGDIVLIDDTYNASPGSVVAALDLLAGLPGRRIAVLGEMLELGEGHESGHRTVGEAAAAVVDRLIVMGEAAVPIAEGARDAGLDPSRITVVGDRDAALDHLRPRLREGDVVLVKASRGIELDLLVDALAAELGPPT